MSDREMQLRVVNGCYTMVPVEEPEEVVEEEIKEDQPVKRMGRPRKA